MNFARLVDTVRGDEQFRDRPYLDSLGVWTNDYGNTDTAGVPVNKDTAPQTEVQARHELHADLFEAALDAEHWLPSLQTLSDVRQEVIVEMAFQLGLVHLAQFVHFRQRLIANDWRGAASHIRDSLWAKQTPARAERAALRMEKG